MRNFVAITVAGCHQVRGAMTQIYSQRMQDGFFSRPRRFSVQLILIWKTLFARTYRVYFFSVVHWFSEIVSFSWQMCQRRLAIPLFPFPFHIRCGMLVFLWYQIRGEYIYIFWLDDVSGQHLFIWYLTAIMRYLTLVQRRISLLSHSLRTMNGSGSLSHIYGLLVGL